jgi:hypothetical protein
MDNPNSPTFVQVWLTVVLICIASIPVMFVLDRWAGLSLQYRVFDSWPRWLRPGRGGWVITCNAVCLAILVLGTWRILPWQAVFGLIWFHMLATFYLDRRHMVEVASAPGTEPDDSGVP